jgi:glycosyltransferase involved in cell wall biosynthesis
MNKGIAVSTGDWILFLGADDRLAGDSVLHAAAQHLQLARADVAVAEVTYDDGRVYRHPSPLGPLARNFIHHQGAFYRRTLFDAGQNFDMTFRVMGDYELNLRFLNRQIQSQPLPLHLTICGSGGISDAGLWLGCTEEIKARHRHAAAWRCWPWDILSIARFLRKRAVRLKRTLRRKAI